MKILETKVSSLLQTSNDTERASKISFGFSYFLTFICTICFSQFRKGLLMINIYHL